MAGCLGSLFQAPVAAFLAWPARVAFTFGCLSVCAWCWRFRSVDVRGFLSTFPFWEHCLVELELAGLKVCPRTGSHFRPLINDRLFSNSEAALELCLFGAIFAGPDAVASRFACPGAGADPLGFRFCSANCV